MAGHWGGEQVILDTFQDLAALIITHIYIVRFICEIMDAQDMILDEITRKQLIWYGHVKRMEPTCLPKIMIHWGPEGRKKRGRPQRTWKEGMYTVMNERDLRMGEWNDRRQWSVAVGRRRQM
jgi:hypothetical protein